MKGTSRSDRESNCEDLMEMLDTPETAEELLDSVEIEETEGSNNGVETLVGDDIVSGSRGNGDGDLATL
jgi:hypothetical protein